jgi:hypothetical protein
MAIFRCVGCSYFHIPEGICFAGFTCTWLPFARFHLSFFVVLFSSLILLYLLRVFVCLPSLVANKTSEADSFRNMKVKTSYTLEDGHVGRNM